MAIPLLPIAGIASRILRNNSGKIGTAIGKGVGKLFGGKKRKNQTAPASTEIDTAKPNAGNAVAQTFDRGNTFNSGGQTSTQKDKLMDVKVDGGTTVMIAFGVIALLFVLLGGGRRRKR